MSDTKKKAYGDEILAQFDEDGKLYRIRFVGDSVRTAMDKLAEFIADLMQPKANRIVREVEANHEPANP